MKGTTIHNKDEALYLQYRDDIADGNTSESFREYTKNNVLRPPYDRLMNSVKLDTREELEALRKVSRTAFDQKLEEWCAGDFLLTEDNYEDLVEAFLDRADITFEDGQRAWLDRGVIRGELGGPYAKRGLRPSVGEIVTVVGVVVAMLVFGIGLTVFEEAAKAVAK